MKNIKIFAIAMIVIASYTNQLFAQETATLKTRTKSNNANERTAGYDVKKATKLRVLPTETGCSIVFDNIGGITGGVVAGKKGYDYYKNSSSFSVSSADNSVSIVSPRDAASGLPTGKRMHKPVVITQELDKSSPTLSESAAKNREASPPSVSEIVVTKSGVQASQSSDAAMSSSTGVGAGKATFKEFTVTKRCNGKTTKIACPDGECEITLDDCPNGTCDLVCSWSWGESKQGTSMSSSGSGRCTVDFSLEIQDGVCMAITEKGLPGGSSKKEKN